MTFLQRTVSLLKNMVSEISLLNVNKTKQGPEKNWEKII